jgi:hypothetical protein
MHIIYTAEERYREGSWINTADVEVPGDDNGMVMQRMAGGLRNPTID